MSTDESPAKSAPAGWPGGVAAAARNALETDPALATGAAWEGLLAELRRVGGFVNAKEAPANDRDRAEGWRHLAALLLGDAHQIHIPRSTTRLILIHKPDHLIPCFISHYS